MSVFKRFIAVLVIAGFAFVGLPALSNSTSSSAEAATVSIQPFKKSKVKTVSKGKVKVSKISNKTVSKGKKAKIAPKVSKSGKSKVISKKVNVMKNGKYVAKQKKSVSLSAGKYRVTSYVKYKIQYKKGKRTYWGKTHVKKVSQILTVKTKPAAKKNSTKKTTVKKATPKKTVSSSSAINTAKGQAEIVSRINNERAKRGLNKLTVSSDLKSTAVSSLSSNSITINANIWNPATFFICPASGSLYWKTYVPSAESWWGMNKDNSALYMEGTHIGVGYGKTTEGYNAAAVIVATKN